MSCRSLLPVAAFIIMLSAGAFAEPGRDHTCFQIAAPYSPAVDIGSDLAVVYGTHAGFADRVAQWRAQGYAVGMMTGISWGDYGDYYGEGDAFKRREVQTRKNGQLYMHGQSTTVGYNVPTPAYIEYIKGRVTPAVEAGVQAVFLEEPEYWAESGWSDAFKEEWQAFYGEPWQEPDSSPDAQYRASRLKYELYFRALQEVFRHVKKLATEKGIQVECHVPTHSLINYAQWRIVSPESHLMDLPEMDGYIAQVWTGTARSRNMYRGVRKERTFETAYLEFGQALGMVRPTGRKVWFLADPVEDNPNYSWNNYRYNYECTIIASLMWPEVHRFEVMPWPDRIFCGVYPKIDLDAQSGDREGIPADYATELLTVINALNEMDQAEVTWDAGTRGIGVMVSDTMMFQRAEPEPSDPMLGSFFALAMPLIKHGVPVEVVQLENTPLPETLAPYKVILMTYEGMKPLKPEYNEAIAQWVRGGGCLLFVDDGADPYNRVREWWNEQGTTDKGPADDLFARLGVGVTSRNEPEAVGAGFVRIFTERPRQLQSYEYGARKIMEMTGALLAKRGETLETKHYLRLQRGPFVVASVLDESISEEPLRLHGAFIDLFDPALPFVTERALEPGRRTLLYDLAWARSKGIKAKVAAAACRVRDESLADGHFRFTTRGPAGTTAAARVVLPSEPRETTAIPDIGGIERRWDADSGTLWLRFPNTAQDVIIDVAL